MTNTEAECLLDWAHDRLCHVCLPEAAWSRCQQTIYKIVGGNRDERLDVVEEAVKRILQVHRPA